MKDIKGTIKFYNTNLVKKTLGTGAFILVADISSSKPFTIVCSIGAGLMIANITSKLKERRNEVGNSEPKKSKRSIIVEKLKELKDELLEKQAEISKEEVQVKSASKIDFNNSTDENIQDIHHLLERAKVNGGRLSTPKSGDELELRAEKEKGILKNKETVVTPKIKATSSDPLGEYIAKQKQLRK